MKFKIKIEPKFKFPAGTIFFYDYGNDDIKECIIVIPKDAHPSSVFWNYVQNTGERQFGEYDDSQSLHGFIEAIKERSVKILKPYK